MMFRTMICVLREHNKTGRPVHRITRGKYFERILLDEFLDGCERLLETSPWISCKDAIPIDGTAAIIWVKALDTWSFAIWDNGYWLTETKKCQPEEISHWIPLTKPKGDNNATENN